MEQTNNILLLLRPGVELVYFLSSVVIAVAAIIALKQIAILKTTIRIQSKRDSLKLTSEQCSMYFSEIIPLQNEFNNSLNEYNIKYFEGWDVAIKNGKIYVTRNKG